MSLAATIDAMVGAGCTAEQVAAVVRVHSAADEQKKIERRAKDAERKRRSRALSANVTRTDAESARPSRTPCDNPSPLLSSPIPPTNNPLPQSSLRSDSVSASARREIDREFEERFWPEWPNRSSKDAAKKAYPKARQIASLEQILSGVRLYRLHKPADRDWMHAATFLNGKRWNDEYSGFNARAGPFERPAKRNTAFAVFERMRDDEPPDENPAPPRSAFG